MYRKKVYKRHSSGAQSSSTFNSQGLHSNKTNQTSSTQREIFRTFYGQPAQPNHPYYSSNASFVPPNHDRSIISSSGFGGPQGFALVVSEINSPDKKIVPFKMVQDQYSGFKTTKNGN